MRRREFITLLGGATAAWPLAARAQQTGRAARIGVFTGATIPVMATAYRGFVDELRRLGFGEGQNLIIELRPGDQESPALSMQAVQLVRSNVDAFVVSTEPALRAAIAASRRTPIVTMAINFDPIAFGYVESLARPGGNVTGVFLRQAELAEKQVELLTQAFPDKTRLTVLWDSISAEQFAAAERRATALRLEVRSLKLENPPYDFDAAFRTIAAADPHMLLVLSSPSFGRQSQRIAQLAIRHRLPAMFIFKAYTEFGGLMSYGADPVAMYRKCAGYVAKILMGAKPADLPVEQPTKFEMVVNLKTAKTLGVELPTSILLRADEVIE